MKDKFQLGDKISYTKILVKFRGENKTIWQDFFVDGEPLKGTVIGIRFVKDVSWSYTEEGTEWQQVKTHKVYLVAETLYLRPTHVPVDGIFLTNT